MFLINILGLSLSYVSISPYKEIFFIILLSANDLLYQNSYFFRFVFLVVEILFPGKLLPSEDVFFGDIVFHVFFRFYQ